MEFQQSNYKIENIASIERLDDFDDEYVYDVEVDDTHMFVANDILVHNSIYCEAGQILRWCKVPRERQTQVVVDLWNYSLGPYMNQCYEDYAKKYNCPKNIQNLELEKIADVTLYFSKKRYAMSECWKEPNIFLPYMSKVVYKGIEIVKGSTSAFVRECIDDFVRFVLRWYGDHDNPIEQSVLIGKLKEYKSKFVCQDPERISCGSSVGDYNKFILNDKQALQFSDKCPAHIRAAGVHNYILNQPKNKKHRLKYSPIKTADKIKWYYTKDSKYGVFAFLPGAFPLEYKLDIDYDTQFEKTILSFCNKVMEIVGYQPVTAALTYSDELF